ncbi:hypothetical protein Tel_04310 [Candidatus Tenderia electrophaga]|uniref:Uncharacterized protein n=1 Tax=Candidatus Tenderia electrophaga TaxID=1748243 RepID=A0A0S2TBA3_9GAMM|nr:hypothetical protein Tel_04310 [Candidatus Tenderia electrophaga]
MAGIQIQSDATLAILSVSLGEGEAVLKGAVAVALAAIAADVKSALVENLPVGPRLLMWM